jgi:beta-galactosidase
MLNITLPKTNASFRRDHLKKQRGKNRRGDFASMNNFHLEFNGKPWLPVMAEFQYARYPAELWEEELRKVKEGGVDIIQSYVFWIHHEEDEGVFDFSGRRDIRRFVELCGRYGLWVMLRSGPFCHAEVANGGLPNWLYSKPFDVRCNDPRYLAHVKRLYGELGGQLKGLMFEDDGPIIGIQCENEFMDSVAPWETTHNTAMVYTPKGKDGGAHMLALKRLALAAGLKAPWFTQTGWGGAPIVPREFLPMYGGYGYYAWVDDPATQEPTGFFLFGDMHNRPNAKFDPTDVPFACCEIGGGMQPFYKNRPVVPPESVEAMHIAQLGSGSNLMGFYIYHGGIQLVGKHSFLHEHRCPRISYDYQAPLSEFGRLRPHYGMLRRQFLFLKEFGERLAPMEISITPEVTKIKPTDTKPVRWVVRSRGDAGFIFVSNFQDHVEMPDKKDVSFGVRTSRGETITLPASGKGLTLKQGVATILPFHFDMDGLLLKSATSQPITRIDNNGSPHYFFSTPRGFHAEYAFETATFTSLETQRATKKPAGNLTMVQAQPGTDSLLAFALPNDRKVFVTTLTDAQSQQLYKTKVAGAERIFLSEAGLVFENDRVEVTQPGSEKLSFAVFPPLKAAVKTKVSADGIFQRHTLSVPRKNIKLAIKNVSDGKVAVRVPKNALDGLNEVYLQIDYIGDVGSAYLGSELIHDNFWNGTTWELAVRPFAPRMLETELVLVLTPLRKHGTKVEYTSMAAMKVVEDAAPMEFRSITAVPVYKGILELDGPRRRPTARTVKARRDGKRAGS